MVDFDFSLSGRKPVVKEAKIWFYLELTALRNLKICSPGGWPCSPAPPGRTSGNVPTIDVLKQCCNLQLLLAPEHGVRGDKAAGALFADELDEGSGLPVRSLYTKDSKRLSRETLALFDTLVYDIADVGCRYYTFLTTLRYCIEDCAAAGKRLVVLDRPNPLGDRVEGSSDCP